MIYEPFIHNGFNTCCNYSLVIGKKKYAINLPLMRVVAALNNQEKSV